jgi:single-strand DNA-binding protein
MFSRTVLIGNLTTDPEVKTGKDGKKRTVYSLDVKRKYSSTGEVDTFKVISAGQQGVNDAKYLQRGAFISTEGRIEFTDYIDRAGIQRTATHFMVDNVSYLGKGGHDDE